MEAPGLDCAERQTEPGGQLRVRQAQKVRVFDKSPLLGGPLDWLPRLDALARANHYFTHFYANGFNTIGGEVALLTGRPSPATLAVGHPITKAPNRRGTPLHAMRKYAARRGCGPPTRYTDGSLPLTP